MEEKIEKMSAIMARLHNIDGFCTKAENGMRSYDISLIDDETKAEMNEAGIDVDEFLEYLTNPYIKFIKNTNNIMCRSRWNFKYNLPPKDVDTEAIKRGTRIHEILEKIWTTEDFFTEYGKGGARKFDFTKIDRETLIEMEELGIKVKDLMFSLDKEYLNSTYGCYGTRMLANNLVTSSIVDGIDKHGAYNIKPNGEKEYLDN